MVLNLDDHRPHILIGTATAQHVIPRSFFEAVIKGKYSITDLDGWQEILPLILKEWLDKIEED